MTRLPTIALLLASALPLTANARFVAMVLSDTRAQLEVLEDHGGAWPLPLRGEQVSFADPKLSANGEFAGWLVESPNCCTSYPIAMELVVMTEDRLV